ncbi:TIGR03086 family metal-binding protein [Cellulomonas sp. 179-A 4D5 NHS]|uniref:TIGR03086 family metal-binding protein n=1 Tax=Cellulomonas sp. 179-A 4D5 NHS TaxID=3142378 RepID=UPI00399FD971
MSNPDLLARAAEPLLRLVPTVSADQLGGPTPCSAWDVRALVDHLLRWAPALEAAGRRTTAPAHHDQIDDLPPGAWADELAARVRRTVDAWSRPDAWEGSTALDGFTLPASVVGGMLVGELVVHGWDLARATGHEPGWDDDVLTYLHGEVAYSARTGREMGVYGPERTVPGSATVLDRTLALTGRDPAWSPTAAWTS